MAISAQKRTSAPPSEASLARAWAERLYPAGGLRTVGGDPLQVVYPGRPNTDRGPDFLDALLYLPWGLVRGAVELHVRASDWAAHGHGTDPHYSHVVLHVVAVASGRATIAGAPVLELPPPESWGETFEGHAPLQQAQGRLLGTPPSPLEGLDVERVLDEMGDARLAALAAALEGEIAVVGPEQAFYRALLTGLGYSKNIAPFGELAHRLPLALLRGLTQGAPPSQREARIAGLLFGVAGLLPSQRERASEGRAHGARTGRGGSKGVYPLGDPSPWDGYSRGAEEAWRALGGMEPLPAGSWRTFRVRPDNHPLRRVGAATALVLRYLDTSLVETMVRAVQGESSREAWAALRAALEMGPQGYWAAHRDFGVALGTEPRALIGRARAGEMAVTAVLPFLIAWADWTGERGFEEAVHAAFRALPMADGSGFARWAARTFLPAGAGAATHTARRQQGLLHLAKTSFPGTLS